MRQNEDEATPFISMDFDNPIVQEFILANSDSSHSIEQQALSLYYAVRDLIRYNPYSFSFSPATFKASYVLEAGKSWCVPKAILFGACTKALGIPTKLGFADVKNHLSTANMREKMKTDVFYWHGYTSIFLFGKWVKATPAFNIELCDKFGLKPLEFDGHSDSLYHEYDQRGQKHMEYLNDRGVYDELPLDEMFADLRLRYEDIEGDSDMMNFEQEVLDEQVLSESKKL